MVDKKPEQKVEEKPKSEEKPKGLIGKLKESIDDREEQMMILSTFVRLGILIWSGAILTLAYVDLPEAFKMPKQDLDPTFIASVFTGVLASFGIQTASKKGDGTMKMEGGGRLENEVQHTVIIFFQTYSIVEKRVYLVQILFFVSEKSKK